MADRRHWDISRMCGRRGNKGAAYESRYFMYLEKEYWEECFSWNSEKSIGLCAARKNEKLSKMAEKSRIEMPRRKKMEKIRWGVLDSRNCQRLQHTGNAEGRKL